MVTMNGVVPPANPHNPLPLQLTLLSAVPQVPVNKFWRSSSSSWSRKLPLQRKLLFLVGFQKYSWFFFIPVPFVICAGFGKLYQSECVETDQILFMQNRIAISKVHIRVWIQRFAAKKNRGLPVNAETGSPVRIHFRGQQQQQQSGGSRSHRIRAGLRSSQAVTIEVPLIPNSSANNSPASNHMSRSSSNQSQRTRSSHGSIAGHINPGNCSTGFYIETESQSSTREVQE